MVATPLYQYFVDTNKYKMSGLPLLTIAVVFNNFSIEKNKNQPLK